MKTRSVRLDKETEELLNYIHEKTDLNITEIFKRGIRTLAKEIDEQSFVPPYEIFKSLDLGSGGESRAISAKAKQEIKKIIAGKYNHDSR